MRKPVLPIHSAPPRRMKAAVNTRYGPPQVVRVIEVDKPTPKDDELLVRVHATTVNRTDCGYRAAKPVVMRLFFGIFRPKVTVLGTEFAGEVEAIGREVTSFVPGDGVFGYIEGRFGAHAEYLTIPEGGSVATMPQGSTYHEVAPGTEGSHYALSFLTKAGIRRGHVILVNGATGAIGSAAVQLAKSLGAEVTAVCGTEQVPLVESLGADRVIDYQSEDFTDDGQIYDAVLDAVGKTSFRRCRRLLKPGGVYASSDLGFLSQNPVLALVTPLFRGRKVVFPIPRHDQSMVRYLGELIGFGQFRPVVDRQYPLDQIVAAYEYVETGQKIGNVVIDIAPAVEGPSPEPHGV